MEIPGKVSVYCPLIDAKGTPATLVTVSPQGYYQLLISVKGQMHTFMLPVSQTGLYFSQAEPEASEEMEIER